MGQTYDQSLSGFAWPSTVRNSNKYHQKPVRGSKFQYVVLLQTQIGIRKPLTLDVKLLSQLNQRTFFAASRRWYCEKLSLIFKTLYISFAVTWSDVRKLSKSAVAGKGDEGKPPPPPHTAATRDFPSAGWCVLLTPPAPPCYYCFMSVRHMRPRGDAACNEINM